MEFMMRFEITPSRDLEVPILNRYKIHEVEQVPLTCLGSCVTACRYLIDVDFLAGISSFE